MTPMDLEQGQSDVAERWQAESTVHRVARDRNGQKTAHLAPAIALFWECRHRHLHEFWPVSYLTYEIRQGTVEAKRD